MISSRKLRFNNNLKKMNIQISMSTDEILPTILGEWTGYVCGKELGKRPPKKIYVQQIDFEASMSLGMCQVMQAEMQRKLQEEREQMAAELLSK